MDPATDHAASGRTSSDPPPTAPGSPRTLRREILEQLRRDGPASPDQLALSIGASRTGVLQQLRALEDTNFVSRTAVRHGVGVVLETPTWRASRRWGDQLGYDAAALDRVNQASVAFLRDLGREHADIELIVRTHAQGRAGVSMRIKVDDEGGDAGGQCRRRQSGGHGCLADTAFEAADAHYLHLKNQYLTPVAETGSCRLLRSSEPGRACATHPLIIC